MTLFEEHLGWAENAARKFCASRRVPRHCWPDCMQAVRIALWKSASRFDASRGTCFRTFFYGRLGGAIRDWLRVEARRVKHHHSVQVGYVRSIDEVGPAGERVKIYARDNQTEQVDARDMAASALRALPAKHRSVVCRIFCSNTHTDDIGAQMGLSETRITQIYQESIRIMRRRFRVAPREIMSIREARAS